jgi:Rieske Fe-S protein
MNRRDFLKLTTNALLWTSGVLGLGGILRFLSYTPPEEAPRTLDLGPAADYPPGTRTSVADGAALLIHDEAGFHALSTTCTHLGCRVNAEPDGFLCPCHGSRFDPQGTVLNGPAQENLPEMEVALDGNQHLILHLE